RGVAASDRDGIKMVAAFLLRGEHHAVAGKIERAIFPKLGEGIIKLLAAAPQQTALASRGIRYPYGPRRRTHTNQGQLLFVTRLAYEQNGFAIGRPARQRIFVGCR